ncbi:hypothetical protein [Bartonella sp. ML70XJBT.G]|uniref:hypothetical protein n=1 Tax=Bartonella sp. ML70XJBT.G TaxID=3019093 RepID=UPI00235F1504|nr:hypothetical protein [Bartonella sp. ML70XJBT.G]
MKKPVFINSNEILLLMCENEAQNLAQAGPFYEEKDIIDFINEADNAVQIFRVEPATNRCEDISEEIAEFYVNENRERLNEHSKVHSFIRESEAFNQLLDDLAQEEYIDKVYGTYEEQNRLRPSDVLPDYPNYSIYSKRLS